MTDPVIIAAAAVLLIPQLAPGIDPIDCQQPPAHPTTVQHANPRALAAARPKGNHISVRWKGSHHHHHHR
jgi:hypothetical protein